MTAVKPTCDGKRHNDLRLCSDTFDLLKWYNTFTAHPEVLGLTKQTLAALTEPLEPIVSGKVKNAFFAQGIVVEDVTAKGKKVRL